jgi:hypothetical protein
MKRRRCYAFLAVSLILFTLLMLTSLREARTQAPYQVTFTASGLDSDAGSNTVLTLGGANYAWNTLPIDFEVDSEGTTFTWASTVSGGSGKQFVETGDSGLASPITANGTDAATYKTQYLVTFTASGLDSDAGSNTVLTVGSTNYAYNALPSGVWVDSGTTFTWSSPVAGVSGERFAYTGDSGLVSPIVSSGTDVATYKTQYQHTITSSPAPGSGYVTVDGGAVTTPYTTPWWDSGSSHTIAANSPVTLVSGQSQYIYSSWSDSGAQSHSVSPTAVTTYTAVFQLQYYFSVSSTYDNPTGAEWYNAGSSVSSTITRPVSGGTGIQFETTGWTGTGSLSSGGSAGSSSTGSFTLNAYTTCTWNWKTQYQVAFGQTGVGSDFLGTVVTVDSVNYGVSSLPVSFWFDSSSSHSFSFASPLAVGSKRYVWGSTSGLSTLQSGTLTVTASGSVVGNYQVQNQVTFDKVGISSDFTGTVVIIDSVSYSISQLPVSFSWSVGSAHSFAFQSPLVVGSTTKQYLWTSTSGLSSVQSGSITITTYGSIIGHYKTQYYLTVSSPHDSPSPVSGWFDSGSSITESVTSPVTEGSIVWTCTGWTGTGSVPSTGSGSSTNFTITLGSSVTWDWQGAVVKRKLTVHSDHGSPSPGVGDTLYDDGSSVNCSVSSPVTEGSTVWTCIGWNGTGSVPSSGSGTTVLFVITRDSSMTWNWQGAAGQHTLTVSSDHDSPNPSNGHHVYSDGSYVTCSVTSPVTEGSIVWTCTGWSGSGSVPSSGVGSSVSFTITQDSSITWNWHGALVQRTLNVYSAHDSPSPANGVHYIDDGSYVTVSVSSPVTESGTVWTCTGWTGSGSVPSSGTGSSVSFTITQDSSITWNWHGNAPQHNLTVTSAHGNPSPAVGNHPYDQGDNVTCSVASPVTENGVTYVCTGWSGAGSVPSTGSGTFVSFTILRDSSITWNWQVVRWKLTVVSAHGNPSPAVGDYFYNDKVSVTCNVSSPVVEVGVSYTCTGWLGTGSVPSNGSGVSVTFSITQKSSVTWNWVVTSSVQWKLTVVSAHGNPDPAVGDHLYTDGASVPCSVASPVVEAGVSYTCIGWNGAGFVPSSGSDISVTFTITENSSITWNWVVTSNVRTLVVTSAHGSPSPSVGDHPYNDGSPLTCSVTSPVTEAGQVWTCTSWVGTGSVPSNGGGTSTTFTITENSSITWNWVVTSSVQWTLTVLSAHGSPSPAVGDHLYNNSSSVVCSVTSPVVEAGVSYTCTGWTRTSTRAMSSGSGTSTTFTITENSTITWNWQETPTIGSCDNTGVQENVFTSDETVYVTGAGYAKNQTFSIYVVYETTWVDGMALPERVQGTATSVSSDSSGNIHTTIVWNGPLTSGNYDILVDVNGNGKYNAQVDAFYSIQIVTLAESFLMPEYIFGTILGLAGCFAALGAFRIYKRRR